MEVEVRLFATFRQGREKKQKLKLEDGTTVKDVVAKLNINEEEVAILLINGFDGKLNDELSNGDVLALFPPVGGG